MDGFETVTEGNLSIIKVSRDLDQELTGELLTRAFNQLFDRGRREIALDLSEVKIISSYGLGRLFSCNQRLKAENSRLKIRGVHGFVKETFELFMLDRFLELTDPRVPPPNQS